MFDSKVQKIAKKTQGQLIIKEYPTASASVDTSEHCLMILLLRNHLNLI
ncbi:MAG: hypothetical protein CM15mV22_0930 [Eurybiavirus sp.]|nr:MAG: hypothetical protein CM15mV22_0930 [Eurybiavirus sp.]